jgi:hypothetical protein
MVMSGQVLTTATGLRPFRREQEVWGFVAIGLIVLAGPVATDSISVTARLVQAPECGILNDRY